MILYDEYFRSISNVDKVGVPNTSDIRIPKSYLDNGEFIVFRTCHSYGDWVLISAMPRLLKQKYPACTVVVPSPNCLAKYFSPDSWHHKHANPFNNVVEIFQNNPYVDGMIDDIPTGMPVYHDHFRVYDTNDPNIPLVEQMLKFWNFNDDEIVDSQPELYWSSDEMDEGDRLISKYFSDTDYGFLYLDDIFFVETDNVLREPLNIKRHRLQKEIDKHNIAWIYYFNNKLEELPYHLGNHSINVVDLNISLRIQNYIKSKAKLVIGHQGGYGTDCMPRYTDCYVVPIASTH